MAVLGTVPNQVVASKLETAPQQLKVEAGMLRGVVLLDSMNNLGVAGILQATPEGRREEKKERREKKKKEKREEKRRQERREKRREKRKREEKGERSERREKRARREKWGKKEKREPNVQPTSLTFQSY